MPTEFIYVSRMALTVNSDLLHNSINGLVFVTGNSVFSVSCELSSYISFWGSAVFALLRSKVFSEIWVWVLKSI
jgi:hypothetical protein